MLAIIIVVTIVGQEFQLEQGRSIDFHLVVIMSPGVDPNVQRVFGKRYRPEGNLGILQNGVGTGEDDVVVYNCGSFVGVLASQFAKEFGPPGLVETGPGNELDDCVVVIVFVVFSLVILLVVESL